MAQDSISMVLFVMSIGGLWNPQDWDATWKSVAYDVYAKALDSFQLTYAILKFMHTYHSKDYKHYSVFLESLFESLYILIITVQRFLIRWDTEKFKEIVNEINRLNVLSSRNKHFSSYEKHSKRINIIFSGGAFVAVLQVLVKLMIGSKRDPASEAYWQKKNPERKLFIDIWLPFDETVSPYHEVIKPLNLLAVILTCFSLYIFSILIPIISIRICFHLKCLANILEKKLIVDKKDVSLLVFSEEKHDLRSLIIYHQKILNLMSKINSLFHVIVLLKILFLSMPILLCALTLSQSPIGSFHFMRYVLLISLPLLELFLFCWYGEQLCSHGLLVHKAVYFCPWYKMGVSQQKSLIFMSTISLRPVRLEIFPHFIPVSLETFIGVIRMSYSAYLMLQRLTTSSKARV